MCNIKGSLTLPLVFMRIVDMLFLVDDRMEVVRHVRVIGEVVARLLHIVRVLGRHNFALKHTVDDGPKDVAVLVADHVAIVNVGRFQWLRGRYTIYIMYNLAKIGKN